MTDYTNPWPSWGESGELPADGFFYEGGDQVNEKHLDALWNTIQTHADDSIQAVEKRVTDFEGNVCLDQGLVASQGAGSRDVDVSASNDGAYISGQHTGAISATTLTLSSNSGGGSTRTDVIYVQQDGSVAKSEGTTNPPNDTLKVAEVDLNTSDTITDIRVYTKRHVTVQASEEDIGTPNSGFGIWLDETDDTFYVRRSGAWDEVAVEGDSVTFGATTLTGVLDVNGNDITDGATVIWDSSVGEIPDAAMGTIDTTTLSTDQFTVTAGDGLKTGGTASLGGSVTVDIEPADFAGTFLSDDGADNLTVDIGTGLENDGAGNIRLDEDYAATWTTTQTFNSGLTSGGDISVTSAMQMTQSTGNLDIAGELTENASL